MSPTSLGRSVRRSGAGFTLIELLIVVAIIGIIASILIPNLLDSMQKAKQKRTVADMKLVGTSWMSWLTDQASSAAAGSSQSSDLDWSSFDAMTHTELFDTLVPQYAAELPSVDGWKNDFEYGSDEIFSAFPMGIRAMGNDRAFDSDSYATGPFVSTDYGSDIVWTGGYFLRWPDGSVD